MLQMVQRVIKPFLNLAELTVRITACGGGSLALDQVGFEDVVKDFLAFAEVEP